MASVALIAGRGLLPLDLARAARRHGHRVVAVGLHDFADPGLAGVADVHHALHVGEIGRLFETLRAEGVESVVLAGKVPKSVLLADPSRLRLDARALVLLRRLADRKDDSILGVVASAIEEEGFRVLTQAELAPELSAPAGALGRVVPSAEQWRDVAFGFPVARALGGVDVGQTVVVLGRAVLALEAIEGTDEAIRRGCRLGGPGASVVKVAKPRQDPRFDVPTVGPDTLRACVEGRAAVLAVEAGATFVLERESLVAEADRHGVAVVGVVESGLGALAA
jgi:DUF1009 family protein